eukprot:524457-Prymnesium_polylepis.1
MGPGRDAATSKSLETVTEGARGRGARRCREDECGLQSHARWTLPCAEAQQAHLRSRTRQVCCCLLTQ